MTFEQLFAILRARWLIASGVFLVVVSTVTAISLLMPKSYTATASVILDVKPDPVLGTLLSTTSPTYLMTQIDVISSQRVARKVVKALNFEKAANLQEKWRDATGGKLAFDDWMANLLLGGLEARPSRGSNVISVSYTGAEPAFSAALANAFVQAYIDTTTELRNAPAKQFSQFFDTNSAQLRERLEAAQTKLSEFQQSQGLTATDERLDIETARLNELSSQLVGSQAAVAESYSRQSAANAQGDKSPDIIANPLVASLKGDLVRQEAQYQQLTTRLGERHPSAIELKASIDETRQRLETEIRRVTTSVGVGNTVNVSRMGQIRASLDQQRAKVLKLKSIRDQASILQREVDNAQRAYEGVVARLNTSDLESKSMQPNVAALEQATPPIRHSSPRITLNIALGLLLGTVLSIGMALVVERADRRLRTTSEVEPLLGHNVIGAIPAFKRQVTKAALPSRLQLSKQPRLKALTSKNPT